jgi:hypothetical protein
MALGRELAVMINLSKPLFLADIIRPYVSSVQYKRSDTQSYAIPTGYERSCTRDDVFLK